MSGFSYDRYDSRRTAAPATRNRTVFGWWMPVMVTTTLAAGGLVAWALRARDDHDHHGATHHDDDDALSYGGDTDRENDHRRPGQRPPNYGGPGPEGVAGQQTTQETQTSEVRTEDNTILGRVSGAIRRTPSPQQIFDGASKKVAAGVAAAGAVVGGALSSIREDREDDFADHQRWKDTSATGASSGSRSTGSRKKRTVAIVLSADEGDVPLEEEEERGYRSEHASLLSQIPPVDPRAINLVILIYSPRNQQYASSAPGANPNAPSSLGSSYSAIPTPGEELSTMEPMPVTPALSARSAGSSYYEMLYRQASRLVNNPVAIMPFTTDNGYIHMLKHLGPEIVYIADSLTDKGANIEQIKDWVGKVVVVVGSDTAGLVDDTEDEMAPEKRGKWYEHSDMIGLGKQVEIVDAVRLEDDWQRRVGGRE